MGQPWLVSPIVIALQLAPVVSAIAAPLTPPTTSWLTARAGNFIDPTRWSAGVPSARSDVLFGETPSPVPFDVTMPVFASFASLDIRTQSPVMVASVPSGSFVLLVGDLTVGGRTEPALTLDSVSVLAPGALTIGNANGPGSLRCSGSTQVVTSMTQIGAGHDGALTVTDGALVAPVVPPPNVSWTVGDGAVGHVTIEAGGRIQHGLALGLNDGEGTLDVSTGGEVNGTVFLGVRGFGQATVGRGGRLDGIVHIGSAPTGPDAVGGSGLLIVNGGSVGGNIAVGDSSEWGEGVGTCSLAPGTTVDGAVLLRRGATPFVIPAGGPIGLGGLHVNETPTLPAVIARGAEVSIGELFVSYLHEAALTIESDAMVTCATATVGAGTTPALAGTTPGFGLMTIERGATVNVTERLSLCFGNAEATEGTIVIEPGATLATADLHVGAHGCGTLRVEDGGLFDAEVVTCEHSGDLTLTVNDGATCTVHDALVLANDPDYAIGQTLAATIHVGAAGRLNAGSITLGSDTTLAVDVGPDQRVTGRSGGEAPIACSSILIDGELTIVPRDELRADDAFVIATGSRFDLRGARLDAPTLDGVPPVLRAAEGQLTIRFVDHVDGLAVEAPQRIAIGEPFELTAIATIDGELFDVSPSVTWTFDPPGVVAIDDHGRGLAYASGGVTATAQFGPLSASQSLGVPAAPLDEFVLLSGVGGLIANGWSGATFAGNAHEELSADGVWAVFASDASNLTPTQTALKRDVFRKNAATGSVTLVSGPFDPLDGLPAEPTGGGHHARISGDGRCVAYDSLGTVSGGEVIVHDTSVGTWEYVAVTPQGVLGDGGSTNGRLSRDGRWVLFNSTSSDLVPGDTNAVGDVFVRDRLRGVTERVSKGLDGGQLGAASAGIGLSDDGRFAFFVTSNGQASLLYRLDRASGLVELAITTASGATPTTSIVDAAVSGDGGAIAFLAKASGGFTDPAGPATNQLFVRDIELGLNEAISVVPNSAPALVWADKAITAFDVAREGRFITWRSSATNLLPESPAPPSLQRLYRHDRRTGVTTMASDGPLGPFSESVDAAISISANGLAIAFATDADNVLPGVTSGFAQAWMRTFPAPIAGDLNGDGAVGPLDLALLLGDWNGDRYDLDGDGIVGADDLAALLAAWTS